MRDRETILKEFNDNSAYARPQNGQILEVLLDIRELLERQENAPQIKLKICEVEEPSIIVNKAKVPRLS
jgi:hypothetical protein